MYYINYNIGLDNQMFASKIVNVFLPMEFNNMFWVLIETVLLSKQHMFWSRNKKKFRYALLAIKPAIKKEFLFFAIMKQERFNSIY